MTNGNFLKRGIAIQNSLFVQFITIALAMSFLTTASAEAPAILSASPSTINAEVGGVVTLTGSGFTGTNSVLLGNKSVSYTVVNSTTLTVTVPPSSNYGSVDVKLTNNDGSYSLSAAFSYTAPPPVVISSVSPSAVNYQGGSSITINGSGFSAYDWNGRSFYGVGYRHVVLGDTSLVVTSVTDNQIVATIPSQQILNNPAITIRTYSNSFTFNNLVTVNQPPNPTITSLTTNSGSTLGGYPTTITGTGFLSVTRVYFGSNLVSVSPMSDTQIQVNVPAATAVGAVNVRVLNNWNEGSLTNAFTYTAPPAPTITSVSPNTGSVLGGTLVTITGTGFNAVNALRIGSRVYYQDCWSVGQSSKGYYCPDSDTSIRLITYQTSLTGAGELSLTTSFTSIVATFTYTAPAAPTITSVSPSTGSATGGTQVTLTGTGFTGITTVKVGNNFAELNSISDTSITFNTPSANALGLADITISNGVTSATATAAFTYTAPAAPTITSVSPNSGSVLGGTLVTITGTGFNAVNSLLLGGINYSQSCYAVGQSSRGYFCQDSATTIRLITRVASSLGAVALTATNGFTSATATAAFTYTAPPAPTITSVSPNTASATGGTQVSITGTNLRAVNVVRFGSKEVFVSPMSDVEITLTAPSSTTASTVDLTVTNGFTSATAAFTYTAPPAPTITAVSQSTGSARGGQVISIMGSGFDVNAAGFSTCTSCIGVGYVKVGQGVAKINSWTASELTVIVPLSKIIGEVDVVVGNWWGEVVSPIKFTYLAVPTPFVSKITPTKIAAYTYPKIVLTGAGFADVTNVTIESASSVKFAVVSDLEMILNSDFFSINGTYDFTIYTPWHVVKLQDALVVTNGAPLPPTGRVGLSIHSGAQFTNSTAIDLSIIWPVGALTVTISNDGGFSANSSSTFSLSEKIPWKLNPQAVVPIPALVYIRFDSDLQTYFDDILVDAIAPILTFVSARS